MEKIKEGDKMNRWLINKNLCPYYHLRHLIGKRIAFPVVKIIEACIVGISRREKLV